MKIALGTDHHGIEIGQVLVRHLRAEGHEVVSLGECRGEPCDYPDNAFLVARAVADGEAQRGILICGTAIGMSIAANKVPGIRAALVHNEAAAEISRRHNDANVLCLSGDTTPLQQVPKIVDAWLDTPFDGGRHERRVRKIMAIERGENPAGSVTDAATA